MTVSAIISVPKPTSFAHLIRLPENPTAKQQREYDAWHSIRCEISHAGQTNSRMLYSLVCLTNEAGLITALDGCGINYTIEHSQDSQKGVVMDGDNPVLDADGNRQYEIKVRKQGSKAKIKDFMPDIVSYDEQGDETGRRRPTNAEVVVGGFMGHERWAI